MRNSELSTFLTMKSNIDSELWKFHLSNMVLDSKVLVDCTTLERIIQDHELNKIDFLKIDTQGTDLSVLLSASSEISKIMSCALEFPYSKASSLYSEEIDLLEGIEELKKVGFTPVRIVPNGAGECNAFFLNDNFTLREYFQMENDLEFSIAPTLKIGRHNPCINMNSVEKISYFAKAHLYKLVKTR